MEQKIKYVIISLEPKKTDLRFKSQVCFCNAYSVD